LSLFASLFWGSNPIRFSGNFSFASTLVLLYRRNLSWAGLLFLPALRFIIWSLPWLLISLKRIYNFWCSMLIFTPFAYCFVTLRGTFMHFSELTY
jgi:hypothetical protein